MLVYRWAHLVPLSRDTFFVNFYILRLDQYSTHEYGHFLVIISDRCHYFTSYCNSPRFNCSRDLDTCYGWLSYWIRDAAFLFVYTWEYCICWLTLLCGCNWTYTRRGDGTMYDDRSLWWQTRWRLRIELCKNIYVERPLNFGGVVWRMSHFFISGFHSEPSWGRLIGAISNVFQLSKFPTSLTGN